MPAPPYLEDGSAMERARTGDTSNAKMKRLFNRMDIFWDRCNAQEKPPSEDDAWHRIKDDYKQSGLLAALLLSVIGPLAVQIPQVMTDGDDWRSHAYATLMGAAALLTLWAVYSAYTNFAGLNLVPKGRTYEYMANLGAFESLHQPLMILGSGLFIVAWLVYISKLIPGPAFVICLCLLIIFGIVFAIHWCSVRRMVFSWTAICAWMSVFINCQAEVSCFHFPMQSRGRQVSGGSRCLRWTYHCIIM